MNTIKTLLIAIIATIIATIAAGMFLTYLSYPDPIIFIENDHQFLIFRNNPSLSLKIMNRGEVPGFATICLYGNNVLFEEYGNVSKYCSHYEFPPMQSSLPEYFEINLAFPNGSQTNFSINITSDCFSKVFGFMPKPCKGTKQTREYEWNGRNYELTNL